MHLLYLALAYLIGIALGQSFWQWQWLGCHTPDWLWLLPLILLPVTPQLNHWPPYRTSTPLRWPVAAGFTAPRPQPTPALLAAIALCLVTGVLRYAAQPLTPCWQAQDLAFYNLPAAQAFAKDAPTVTVMGYISSYPLRQETRQRFDVTVKQLITNSESRQVQGSVRLTTSLSRRYHYGEAVRLEGRLVTPPDFEDFSYREYLARKGVNSLFYPNHIDVLAASPQGSSLLQSLYALRARGEALLNALLPEPYAALANGMLLGIEAGIPDSLYEQFNLTGSSHVIVISGSNVALIAGVIMALGQRLLGQRRAIWLTLTGIGCYALLVGGDAAVLRAALMGGLYALATALERRSTALVSLAFACWVMTLANPLTLWDVGFQLSSAATAGLIVFAPGVTTTFHKLWTGITQTLPQGGDWTNHPHVAYSRALAAGLLQDGFLLTIAANISTLPLILYYFGRLSVVSLLTNLAIAPVQPYIMLWGGAALLVGVAGSALAAQLLLWVPWLCLLWTVKVVQWSAALPGASVEISNFGLGQLTATYLLIALWYSWGQWASSWRRAQARLTLRWQRGLSTVALSGLAISTILIWSAVRVQPDGRLHLYFLNIGQGDGILIQTPSGRQLLIDGGAEPQRLQQELGAVLPFWDRTLDLILMTHPDSDHMGAQVYVPERFQLTTALESPTSQVNSDAGQWHAAMATASVDLQVQYQGGWLDLGDGVALWVLWPTAAGYQGEDADNQNSLVTKLVYGDFSVLLTGDAGIPSEEILLQEAAPLTSTVLKVGHHGSKSGSSSAFVEAVNPQIAVIQVGADNRYGHPHQEVLDHLAGRMVLRNDRDGRIHLYSDGHQLWMETETGAAF
ncbi:MAG: DNA internalization-related competence protein ComEC/Rec2 [Caldilineaceae bacterium]